MTIAQTVRRETIRALTPDWRDHSWRQALARALTHAARIRWERYEGEGPLLVSCAGACRSGSPWHRVEWTAHGIVCDCPSRRPCHHRARAWAEWLGEWKRLSRIAREHGIESAVRWLVVHETGVLDLTPIRPLRDVRLWRERGAPYADVPHYQRHSASLEWGYGGAGPADLAYSILTYFYGPAVAEILYQEFKWDVIARIPRDASNYTIQADQIAGWVESAAVQKGWISDARERVFA